jgi:hypothetical protein
VPSAVSACHAPEPRRSAKSKFPASYYPWLLVDSASFVKGRPVRSAQILLVFAVAGGSFSCQKNLSPLQNPDGYWRHPRSMKGRQPVATSRWSEVWRRGGFRYRGPGRGNLAGRDSHSLAPAGARK